LHPVFAEMAMALSSITVVTNANLLRRKKIWKLFKRINSLINFKNEIGLYLLWQNWGGLSLE
jgi:hypothetical protein